MFVNAIKKPINGDGIIKTMLIGTVLIFLSIFILPIFILMGFAIKSIKNATEDEPIPRFSNNYKELFMIGLKYAGVALIFSILFMIISGIVQLLAMFVSETVITILMLIFVLPIYLVYLYVLPAIMYEYSNNYRIKDAFNFRKMSDYIKTWEYVKITLIISIAIPILIFVVNFVLGITIVGLLLIPAVSIYVMLVQAEIISHIDEI